MTPAEVSERLQLKLKDSRINKFSSYLLLLVQYASNLYQYFKEWRKNPQWSFSCCLTLLLTLNDLQGDVSGLAETNVLKSQLDTGDFSVPTILDAVKDSGAIDVTLEEVKEGDDSTEEAQDSCKGTKYRKKKSHRWTQTEPFSLSNTDIEVHGLFEKKYFHPCEYNARTCNTSCLSHAVIFARFSKTQYLDFTSQLFRSKTAVSQDLLKYCLRHAETETLYCLYCSPLNFLPRALIQKRRSSITIFNFSR